MKHSINLGYACINTTLAEKGYKVNNTCIAKTVRQNGVQFVIDKVKTNLENVIRILEWNDKHKIYFYRMSSNMFPHITNQEFIQSGNQYAYPLEQFSEYFRRIGEFAFDFEHRITFHPGHYNQIGTPNPDVFNKTKSDLSCHADILDLCQLGKDSVMVVHGGGVYEDKTRTKKRWVEQFHKLPRNVKDRIVIENCERLYSIFDMLEISEHIQRPVVFDTHHHSCYSLLVEEQPDPITFLPQVVETWERSNTRCKFHVSEQNPLKRVGAHSEYVKSIPNYFWKLYNQGYLFDIMIEAKAKEKSVLKLHSKYSTFFD